MKGSIFTRIERAIGVVPEVRSGLPDYAALIAECEARGGTRADRIAVFREGVVEVAAGHYRASVGREVELLEFSDGAFDFLFDYTLERTVLAHGLSRTTAPGTRDGSYHKGYPGRAGFEKGHAMAHAMGGREGGPNYFPQRAALNRRLSPKGHLWRDIETWLAANAGVYAFVRMSYPPGDPGDEPAWVEYGIFDGDRQFRSVDFSND